MKMRKTRNPVIRARRYSDWARKQIALAEQASFASSRVRHAALAAHYLEFAERELIAAIRLGNGDQDHKGQTADYRPDIR